MYSARDTKVREIGNAMTLKADKRGKSQGARPMITAAARAENGRERRTTKARLSGSGQWDRADERARPARSHNWEG